MRACEAGCLASDEHGVRLDFKGRKHTAALMRRSIIGGEAASRCVIMG